MSNGGVRVGEWINIHPCARTTTTSPPPDPCALPDPVKRAVPSPRLDGDEGGADGGDHWRRSGEAGEAEGDQCVVPDGEGPQRCGGCGEGEDGRRRAPALLPQLRGSIGDGCAPVGDVGSRFARSREALQVAGLQITQVPADPAAHGAGGGGDGAPGPRDTGGADRDNRRGRRSTAEEEEEGGDVAHLASGGAPPGYKPSPAASRDLSGRQSILVVGQSRFQGRGEESSSATFGMNLNPAKYLISTSQISGDES